MYRYRMYVWTRRAEPSTPFVKRTASVVSFAACSLGTCWSAWKCVVRSKHVLMYKITHVLHEPCYIHIASCLSSAAINWHQSTAIGLKLCLKGWIYGAPSIVDLMVMYMPQTQTLKSFKKPHEQLSQQPEELRSQNASHLIVHEWWNVEHLLSVLWVGNVHNINDWVLDLESQWNVFFQTFWSISLKCGAEIGWCHHIGHLSGMEGGRGGGGRNKSCD